MFVIIINTLFANASNLIKSFKKGFDANFTLTEMKSNNLILLHTYVHVDVGSLTQNS